VKLITFESGAELEHFMEQEKDVILPLFVHTQEKKAMPISNISYHELEEVHLSYIEKHS
jgi:hypothetical protein